MTNHPYDLESVKLPVVQGAALRLVVALAESPITAPLIVPSLLKNGGITEMRQFRADDPPTYIPLWAHEKARAEGDALDLSALPASAPAAADFRFHTVRDFAAA